MKLLDNVQGHNSTDEGHRARDHQSLQIHKSRVKVIELER